MLQNNLFLHNFITISWSTANRKTLPSKFIGSFPVLLMPKITDETIH